MIKEHSSPEEAYEDLFSAKAKSSSNCSGGCINTTAKIVLTNNKTIFLKQGDNDFHVEADGLIALSNYCNTPEILSINKKGENRFLLLSYIEPNTPSAKHWKNLGSMLAKMHKEKKEVFGWEINNLIGSSPQRNTTNKNWPTFFAEERLLYQLNLAEKKGHITRELSKGIELITSKIKELLPSPTPSLLHGDLWSGNVMYGENNSAYLIDPAVYIGDREADIAMTELFGGFAPAFYSSYNKHFPLDKGYKDRKDLYNLYHILNHLNIFGTSYYRQCLSIINKYK